MKSIGRVIAILIIAWGVLLTPASSANVTLTWTGEIGGGTDGLGLFGPAGPITAGTPYSAVYVYDTTISFQENLINGSQEVSGGQFYIPFRPSPLVSATITVNGNSFNMDGGYNSQYFRQSGQGASNVSNLAQRLINENPQPYGGELFQRISRLGNFYGLPLDLPAEIDIDAADNPGGNFSYFNRDANGNLEGSTTGFNPIPSHLSIAVVPEPEAILLVSGMWLIGEGLFFRRRVLARSSRGSEGLIL